MSHPSTTAARCTSCVWWKQPCLPCMTATRPCKTCVSIMDHFTPTQWSEWNARGEVVLTQPYAALIELEAIA